MKSTIQLLGLSSMTSEIAGKKPWLHIIQNWMLDIFQTRPMLVGGLEHLDYFSIQLGIIIPTD